MSEIPTWRLREELRKTAERTIEGRKNFEEHTGRVSTKPLTPISLDPTEVLQLLEDYERQKTEPTDGMVYAANMALQDATGRSMTPHTVRRMIEAALKAQGA